MVLGIQIFSHLRDTPLTQKSYLIISCIFIVDNYIGSSVKNAVVTVPAYFNDSQRQVSGAKIVKAEFEKAKLVASDVFDGVLFCAVLFPTRCLG